MIQKVQESNIKSICSRTIYNLKDQNMAIIQNDLNLLSVLNINRNKIRKNYFPGPTSTSQ